MEAWDKDGEEGRADEEQDTGREKDDMTGDGKVEWHGNGEVEKEEGSEVKVAWSREVEEEGAEDGVGSSGGLGQGW